MSEENETPEEGGISSTQKMILAVAFVFGAGYFMVFSSKNETKSPEQLEAEAQVSTLASMQQLANKKCPALIKEHTGEQTYFPSDTKSDRSTFLTMIWEGENKTFKKAECTLTLAYGGISKLVIDDKVIFDRNK